MPCEYQKKKTNDECKFRSLIVCMKYKKSKTSSEHFDPPLFQNPYKIMHRLNQKMFRIWGKGILYIEYNGRCCPGGFCPRTTKTGTVTWEQLVAMFFPLNEL